jgi:hypothetical protein
MPQCTPIQHNKKRNVTKIKAFKLIKNAIFFIYKVIYWYRICKEFTNKLLGIISLEKLCG